MDPLAKSTSCVVESLIFREIFLRNVLLNSVEEEPIFIVRGIQNTGQVKSARVEYADYEIVISRSFLDICINLCTQSRF